VLTAVVLLAMDDLELAAASSGPLRRRRSVIAERITALESLVAERAMPVVGQHGDLRPEDVFIAEDRVEVIDFGCYREGLPLEDVAQLLVQLEVAFGSLRMRRHLPELRQALLEGYGLAVDRDALQLFTITKALHLLARGGAGEQTAARERLDVAALSAIIVRSIG
jgi:Ser/Thr protein kinase RdoA (MazF antagonist)